MALKANIHVQVHVTLTNNMSTYVHIHTYIHLHVVYIHIITFWSRTKWVISQLWWEKGTRKLTRPSSYTRKRFGTAAAASSQFLPSSRPSRYSPCWPAGNANFEYLRFLLVRYSFYRIFFSLGALYSRRDVSLFRKLACVCVRPKKKWNMKAE